MKKNQGADHENNQGAGQGQIQKVIPLIGIPVAHPVDSQNKFNSPTGMPFAGAEVHRGDVNRQPMSFTGVRDHQGDVTRQPMPVVHPSAVNPGGPLKSA